MSPINALYNYKQKVENAVSMVATMSAEQKLEAVQFWNIMSEKLQDIVNHCAADISAISFALEKEKQHQQQMQYIEDGAGQTYHLLTSTTTTGSTMALITKYNKDCSATTQVSCPKQVGKTSITQKVVPNKPESLEVIEKVIDKPPEDSDTGIRHEKEEKSNTGHTHQTCKEIVECDYCEKTFTSSTQLSAHRWKHIKPYICDECGARFASKGNLIVHTRSHTGEKPYSCALCGASFSTRGNLKRHDKAHSGAKPWECSQCGARFTENKSLKVHMRRHTGERPYKCTLCPKAFAQKSILQTHMTLHLGQKSHLCVTCGKAFRQKSQLRLHTLRHSNIKRFTCPSCPAQFLTKGDMHRHRRTHTGERPFSCGLCKKTFTRQQTLTEHMNRHYGLKPYLCKYCRKPFAEMSACYKHIKIHEKDTRDANNTVAVAETIDSMIIDAGLVSIAEQSTTSVIVEHDALRIPNTLEVGRNEQVVSSTIQDSNIGTKAKAVSVVQKVKPSEDTLTNIVVIESSNTFN